MSSMDDDHRRDYAVKAALDTAERALGDLLKRDDLRRVLGSADIERTEQVRRTLWAASGLIVAVWD
jgi:hypothetical protein